MAITTNATVQGYAGVLRPFTDKQVNWAWLLQRLPIFVLSIESSYNVWGYLRLTGTNPAVSLIGSIGFDIVFIGMVALSDQIRELVTDELGKVSKHHIDWLFWCINLGALLAAFLGGLLYHSGGSYSKVTAESLTRAAMFPVLSLLYTLYFDKKVKKIKEQHEGLIRAYPLACEYCGKRYKSDEVKKLNGHKAQCEARKQHNASGST